MKRILLISILILPVMAVYAEESMTYTVEVGGSFTWPGPGHHNPKNQLVSLGIRKYFNRNLYAMGKVTHWDKRDFKTGTFIGVGVGGRTSGKYFVDGSLGVGYLDNPDGQEVEDGYLTGHRQFELNLGGGYRVNQNTTILAGWTHVSNCHKVCRLSEQHKPNKGRDFLRIGIEKKF